MKEIIIGEHMIITPKLVSSVTRIYNDFELNMMRTFERHPLSDNVIEVTELDNGVNVMKHNCVGTLNRVFDYTVDDQFSYDSIHAIFEEDKLDYNVSTTPLTKPSDLSILIDNGLRPGGLHTKLVASLESFPEVRTVASDQTDNIELTDVTQAELDEFVEVYLSLFSNENWQHAPTLMKGLLSMEGVYLQLARYFGQIAGFSILYIQENEAYLAGAGTFPEFRSKGVHTANIKYRKQLALEMGCQILVGAANFGTASMRNMQRAGLDIAWTSPTYYYRFES